ncbi:MAG: hypothetical protein ACE37J_20340 [Pikeienuella sp.]|uniref:hypothetical protein n=1 Tax=Pikeienuella sp. TaxID=2831957 RepID=UPI003918BE92
MIETETNEIAEAYTALVEILYLNADARLMDGGLDRVDAAIARTSSILLERWAARLETALRAMARDGAEPARPDNASEPEAFDAPERADERLERVSALLRRVLRVVETERFRAADQSDCAETTRKTLRAIETLRALWSDRLPSDAARLNPPVARPAAPEVGAAPSSECSPRLH